MANKANIGKVIDAILNESVNGVGFNMSTFGARTSGGDYTDHSGRGCGTVACIAGWARALRNGANADEVSDQWSSISIDDGWELEANWLGLSHRQGELLFLGLGCGSMLEDITLEQAVGTLCHLADTGEVNWKAPPADLKTINTRETGNGE